ncbi:hypothetical protein ACTMU2_26065 [Cupriavidus basilensis]
MDKSSGEVIRQIPTEELVRHLRCNDGTAGTVREPDRLSRPSDLDLK